MSEEMHKTTLQKYENSSGDRQHLSEVELSDAEMELVSAVEALLC